MSSSSLNQTDFNNQRILFGSDSLKNGNIVIGSGLGLKSDTNGTI